MNIKARIAAAIIFPIISMSAAWISGFDFNERGEDALFVFLIAISSLFFGASCPLFDKE